MSIRKPEEILHEMLPISYYIIYLQICFEVLGHKILLTAGDEK
jgi:hypothetical protein